LVKDFEGNEENLRKANYNTIEDQLEKGSDVIDRGLLPKFVLGYNQIAYYG
jgi:hypothetical protein